MTRAPLPVVVLACRVLQDALEPLLPADVLGRATFLDYGLHRVPSHLREKLQEMLDGLREPSLVLLGYGLCGNGLDGIEARQHTLVVPRVDDCIALLLGSRKRYREEFARQAGTYWLSKGWLEAGSDPLREYEKYVPLYGEEEAAWVMDEQYRNYRRLAFVARSPEDLDRYRDQALRVARFCERWGMRYEEMLGSDELVLELAAATGGELPEPSAAGDSLLVVPPGGRTRASEFRP